MKSASININSSQLEAVTTTEGPVLIIAGPGSGKTFTLVERITYLITEKNISPENILISTFTEKAAKEGVVIKNLSPTDPIVILKHFSDNPDLIIQ